MRKRRPKTLPGRVRQRLNRATAAFWALSTAFNGAAGCRAKTKKQSTSRRVGHAHERARACVPLLRCACSPVTDYIGRRVILSFESNLPDTGKEPLIWTTASSSHQVSRVCVNARSSKHYAEFVRSRGPPRRTITPLSIRRVYKEARTVAERVMHRIYSPHDANVDRNSDP